MATTLLQALPYAAWEPTKRTLHLWTQIAGKIRLALAPHRNHWWHVTLHVNSRGLYSPPLLAGDVFFDMTFDFDRHVFEIAASDGRSVSRPLHDGLSVATFYRDVMKMLDGLGVRVRILAKPYGVDMHTPFADDEEHHSYDGDAVRRWWHILGWTRDVFEEHADAFIGKTGPMNVFWHTLDFALSQYSGRRAPERPGASRVEQEAYSHEVIAVGFWAGDANVPMPAYYTYTAPEPPTLTSMPLQPVSEAKWVPSGSGHLGILPYDAVFGASDQRGTLLAFLKSGFNAGFTSGKWPPSP
ncbi:MAG: hypothetical protein JO219_02030 [Candidatus Eremiobacteraeota bacterium]|nr:hypothetical protein [Candidatus Eremiobacteraeota bacterium]MBV8366613.1 hypothetical protein [Candidatus Eremiobacteraeota bacterium]